LAKKKARKPQREFTKQQLSRWELQKKRQRIIRIVGIFIIAAVIVIVGAGWYLSQHRPLQQTAIRVNNTEFTMNYYVEMLKIYSWNVPDSNIPYLADDVVQNIERNELIRQEALKLGISVTDEEVMERLESYSLPDEDVQRDLVRTQLLISRLLDEHLDQQVPVSAEQVHLMAMLLESEPQAKEIRARLENSNNFTELAGEHSIDPFSEINQGDFGWHPEVILNELLPAHIVEFAFNSGAGTLSLPTYDEEAEKGFGYWLVRVLDRNEEEEEAHIQIMLLGSEDEAQEARNRLEAGADFATLAKELSQLEGVKENEGEYMVSPGMVSPVVDEFAFDLEVALETISEPLRDETVFTEGGYWLVKIVAKDGDRPIEDEDRDRLKEKAYNEWVASLWGDPANEIDDSYLDTDKKAWAVEQVIRART